MLLRSRSIGEAQLALGPAAPGFDFLRLSLALYVIVSHCLSIPDADGQARWVWEGWFGPIQRAVLPMFFALSGFLVAGSFGRNTLVDFVLLRALRIVPALAFEVVLAAVLLGSLFTTLPLVDYWTHPDFRSYFLNIVGDIHFELPGVFDGARINGQLWTIPMELQCYLALVALGLCGGARRRFWLLAAAATGCAAMTTLALGHHHIHHGPVAPRLVFVLSFLFGVLLYFYRERVALRPDLFAASLACTYLCLYIADLAFLAPLPVAYLTVSIGFTRLPRLPLGDLSYGMYLFHYPVLAALWNGFGQAAGSGLLFALGLPITLLLALASWRWVENPVLQRKGLVLEWRVRTMRSLQARLVQPMRNRVAAAP